MTSHLASSRYPREMNFMMSLPYRSVQARPDSTIGRTFPESGRLRFHAAGPAFWRADAPQTAGLRDCGGTHTSAGDRGDGSRLQPDSRRAADAAAVSEAGPDR